MPARELLMPALEQVLYSGQLAEGEAVYKFESEFRDMFGLDNVLALSSGTAALHASLVLAGVGSGDEVITTAMTAEPTNTSILYCGATPMFADVDPGSGNLCPLSVRAKITARTKAIIVVHYAGYPARMDELRAVADEFGVSLIEDCAHALGARYKNHAVGTIGDYAIFSFQAIKHMTTVDGGILRLRDPQQITEAKKFRWFGMLKGIPRTEVDITTVGYKYNMSNVNATIGLIQLAEIRGLIARYIDNGRYYDQRFAGHAKLGYAVCEDGVEPSYWLYTLLCESSLKVEQALAAIGVAASKLHRPNNRHTIFDMGAESLPQLDRFYDRLLHLPCGWWVTDEQRVRIADIVLENA